MGIAIVSGLIGIAGILIGLVWSLVLQRSAARAADRARAADLFTQAARAITAMETELELFRHRRLGRHAVFIAVGNVAMQALAGKFTSGNWVSGAASGLKGMTAWDSAEGGRFTDRYFAARSDAVTALVQLSLMSDGLQKTAGEVHDALSSLGDVRKQRDREAAAKPIGDACGALRVEHLRRILRRAPAEHDAPGASVESALQARRARHRHSRGRDREVLLRAEAPLLTPWPTRTGVTARRRLGVPTRFPLRRLTTMTSLQSSAFTSLAAPYPVVRWTDQWGTRWEHKRGVVRRVSDTEPWEP